MNNKKKSKTIRNDEVIRKFGQHLKHLRQQCKLSQEELSYQSGITVTYISKIENGRFNTSLSHLSALADAFEIPIHELLNFTGK